MLVKLRGEKTYCAAIMHRNTIHAYDEGGQLLFLFARIAIPSLHQTLKTLLPNQNQHGNVAT
jgi:hypothetical protein